MKRYKRNRVDGDCDSLHSYTPFEPMSFGNVPISMDEDYTKNGARCIIKSSRIMFYQNFPHCAEESEAYFIDKIYKI